MMDRRTALGALGVLGSSALMGGTAQARQRGDLPPAFPPESAPPVMPVPIISGVRGRMTGARAAVHALCLEGTSCVFGVPGAQSNEFWDAMKSLYMPYMLVTNEYSASIMADASWRATGRVGVFSVVPGPGLTNAMTGIGEALYDSVPIVGLVTDINREPSAPIGQVHGLYNSAIMRTVTKGVFEVRHPSQIPAAIHQAFRLARCGEPGPTAVLIPYTMYNEVWDYDEPLPAPTSVAFDEEGYRQTLRLLADRKLRVGIYAGQGCVDASGHLQAVAELLQAPVATSVSGKGVIPEHHPLSVGWGYGAQGTRTAEAIFKRDVDLVLAVGVRYSENSTANYAIPKHKHLIHVDANPHNLGRNVPADTTLCADSRVFLTRLLQDGAMVRRAPCPDLWRKISERRKIDRAGYQQPMVCEAVDPMYFLTCLRQELGPDNPLLVDVTSAVHWASEGVEVAGPRRFFTPANNQSMGWTIPAAVGVQRVRPDRIVAAVAGDGCFLMTGLEASTAVREGLPVKFFVLDDGAYHYMQMLQQPTYRRTTATEIARLDHGAFAKALGLGFQSIQSNSDVTCGIRRALCMPGPVLTCVRVSYKGREIRWMEALRSQYMNNLSTKQMMRMGTRIAMRSLDPLPRND